MTVEQKQSDPPIYLAANNDGTTKTHNNDVDINCFAQPVFVATKTPKGELTLSRLNAAMAKMYNCEPQEIENLPIREWMPPAAANQFISHIEQCIDSGKPFVCRKTKKEQGRIRHWQALLTPQIDERSQTINVHGICNDITESKEFYLQELTRFSDIHQAYSNFKNNFLTAAHDLRSPICQLDSMLKLINMNMQKKDFEEVNNILELSEGLIVSTLSNIDAVLSENLNQDQKQQHATATQIELAAVYSDIQLLLDPMEKIKLSGQNAKVLSNRPVLHTILRNLIDNAIKHNVGQDNLHITITLAQEQNNMLRFSVVDNGKGMDAERIYINISQPNQAISGSRLGFGLATMKKWVNANGGKLELTSPPKKGSRGTKVCFSLPGQILDQCHPT